MVADVVNLVYADGTHGEGDEMNCDLSDCHNPVTGETPLYQTRGWPMAWADESNSRMVPTCKLHGDRAAKMYATPAQEEPLDCVTSTDTDGAVRYLVTPEGHPVRTSSHITTRGQGVECSNATLAKFVSTCSWTSTKPKGN